MPQNITSRIFGIGLNKTGTTTLSHCFKKLGLNSLAKLKKLEKQECIREIINNENYEPSLLLAEKYRCFEDRPWNIWQMYQKLDERFEGSRFILTIREELKWWKSVEHWLTIVKPDMLKRYCDHLQISKIPSGRSKRSWLTLFAKGAYRKTISEADRAAMVAKHKEEMIKAFHHYNNSVIKYFSGRSDFLILNFEDGDGWGKLCNFLNMPVPQIPLPHANKQFYDRQDTE